MILASSGRESEGGFTPPPLKRARLSTDTLIGGPSITGTSSSSSQGGTSQFDCVEMESGHLKCKAKGRQSNGVINQIGKIREDIPNGYSSAEELIQNGDCEKQLERKRKNDRKMTTMEKDIISLIGQHLREKGYR